MFGIREPWPNKLKPVSPQEIDIVFVPGLLLTGKETGSVLAKVFMIVFFRN
jgi:hypothetical protein